MQIDILKYVFRIFIAMREVSRGIIEVLAIIEEICMIAEIFMMESERLLTFLH